MSVGLSLGEERHRGTADGGTAMRVSQQDRQHIQGGVS
jgi:hypothetical protein